MRKIKNSIKNDKELKSEEEQIVNDLFCNNAKKLYLSGKKLYFSKSKIIVSSIIAAFAMFCGYVIQRKEK